jgi:DNA-binding CsgD family transcriptional regulator
LLVIDDLHWADAESVEALTEVAARADGDRLLMALATRPLPPGAHPRWQRWSEQNDRVRQLTLTGLDLDTAIELLREHKPALDVKTVREMWEHTGGNPLYLLALAAEHEPGELARAWALPAPASLTASVAGALNRLPPSAVSVARAIAILGDRWNPLPVVAALRPVDDLSGDLQRLVDARLVHLRPDGARPMVRVAHSLTRAAIYHETDLPTRRELHARAAQLFSGHRLALDHRVAAAESFDDALADDLEEFANQLHDKRSHRLAAHYRAVASDVTQDAAVRERRSLDALFDRLLSGERQAIRDEMDLVSDAADHARRDLVLGTLAIWERRYAEGIAILEATPADEADPLTSYRIHIMLAWGLHMFGSSSQRVSDALDRAGSRGQDDGSLRHLALLCRGQLAARSLPGAELLALTAALPSNPAEIPNDANPFLALRSFVHMTTGLAGAANADLVELVSRIQKGFAELGSGVYHAMLAGSQWFHGEWGLARLNMRLALDISGQYLHPVVAALAPLVPIGDGDFDGADEALATAHDLVDPAPWVEAVDLLDISDVVRDHASGDPTGAAFHRMRRAVDDVSAGRIFKSPHWSLHAGLAAVSAGEFGEARACAELLGSSSTLAPWTAAVADWLSGLVAEAAGDGKTALSALRRAVDAPPANLPLYSAHMHTDFSRVAHVLGHSSTARRALAHAADVYRQIGAPAYLSRHESLLKSVPAQRSRSGYALTDRERDVLTLVSAGMSYAQISRTLFITQSTVGFHLGRIYAKANVNSRHQLTQLVHSDPEAFGLT